MFNTFFKLLLVLILATSFTTGCAVNMAAEGQDGPDVNVVKKQRTRDDVERMLGLPTETVSKNQQGVTELYIVKAKTEPSMARAVGHATVDLFSFGLWEFVGGPIEAYKGRAQRIFVTYDDNDNVRSISSDRSLTR